MMPIARALCASALLAAAVAIGGCAAPISFNSVEVARTALLGFTEDDIRMCAGFPTRTSENADISIWSYETRPDSPGLSVSAPILMGLGGSTNLTLPSGGSCRAQFLFRNGRLERLSYAGNNDSPRGRDTLCTQVVDDCLTYGRLYGRGTPHPAAAPAAPLVVKGGD